MRNTIIGIIIGIVFGVMAGATIITPGLNQARQLPKERIVMGREDLELGAAKRDQDQTLEASQGLKQQTKPLRIISLFAPKSSTMKGVTNHLQKSLPVSFHHPDTIVPNSDTVDAVKSGVVDGAFGAPDQWDVNSPTLQLFSAIPFGPDVEEYLAWFYYGGGQALFESQFKRKGVQGILCGILPAQGSGWYKTPVRSLKGLDGLNVQAQGLGSRVLKEMGVKIHTLDSNGILKAFKYNEIDGAEYALPSIDAEMGFARHARNYYFPSWQQPVKSLALLINAKTWKRLPARTQSLIYRTCGDTVRYALTRAGASQFEALKKLGLAGVQVRRWPEPILEAFKAQWKKTARELVQKDPDFNAAWSSLHRFRRDYAIWRELSRP